MKVEVQQRMAEMVDQFNKLVDEHRYAEAEVVANRLYEMAPDELVAQQIKKQAKMIRRERWSRDINAQSEKAWPMDMLDIRRRRRPRPLAGLEHGLRASAPTGTDVKTSQVAESTDSRAASIKELEIEQKLKTPVLPRYDETPLTKVVESLSQLAGVNIHLDPRGLEQEGVRSDTPITLNLPQEISLKSALQLILEPLHLTYTIKDEVLKITSEQIRDGDLKIAPYSGGRPGGPHSELRAEQQHGPAGADQRRLRRDGRRRRGVPGPMAVVAGRPAGPASRPMPPERDAQQFAANPAACAQSAAASRSTAGPGGLGGAATADFDSLIDLIISTVEHESWMENGTGEGEIQPFPTNLSLVISQTQRVHEQIADLLEQLRRLQDLQVTIEVRFIRLTDSFFERIGVDFDFNIEDGTGISTNATCQSLPPEPRSSHRAPAPRWVSSRPAARLPQLHGRSRHCRSGRAASGWPTPQFGAFRRRRRHVRLRHSQRHRSVLPDRSRRKAIAERTCCRRPR